jgi:hypothetical protein
MIGRPAAPFPSGYLLTKFRQGKPRLSPAFMAVALDLMVHNRGGETLNFETRVAADASGMPLSGASYIHNARVEIGDATNIIVIANQQRCCRLNLIKQFPDVIPV